MIAINFLHFMWLSYSFIVTFSGLNVLYVKNIPYIFIRLYSFGKLNKSLSKKNILAEKLEVPKRWFSHFYVFAAFYISFVMISVCLKYFGGYPCNFLIFLLNNFASPERKGTTLPESVVIVSVLLSAQVLRRCYECFYISVFSDSKMNVLHYIVGFTFYWGIGLSLLHDAPGFENAYSQYSGSKKYISGHWFLWQHIVGSILFLSAFVLQFQTHKRFATLRMKGENVVSLDHHKPDGGFFLYVSCPHYFAEIVMYLSAFLILGFKSYTWLLVCLWTMSNQVLNGLMSHQFYLKKFEDYPSERKAVIPFLL